MAVNTANRLPLPSALLARRRPRAYVLHHAAKPRKTAQNRGLIAPLGTKPAQPERHGGSQHGQGARVAVCSSLLTLAMATATPGSSTLHNCTKMIPCTWHVAIQLGQSIRPRFAALPLGAVGSRGILEQRDAGVQLRRGQLLESPRTAPRTVIVQRVQQSLQRAAAVTDATRARGG